MEKNELNKNLGCVIHWGVSFFFLFTAFATCQNIVSEALDQNNYGGLGFYTLAALYITFGICSFLSTPLINRLGSIRAMQLGSVCFFIWVCAGILPVIWDQAPMTKLIISTILILAGIINGFGASILWVGQGKYISDCATKFNMGYYFGLFWWIFMLSQIFGNVIAAFLLRIFPQKVFFMVMSAFAFLGVCLFMLLKVPEQKSKGGGFEPFLLQMTKPARTHLPKEITISSPLLIDSDDDSIDEPQTAKVGLILLTANQVGSGKRSFIPPLIL